MQDFTLHVSFGIRVVNLFIVPEYQSLTKRALSPVSLHVNLVLNTLAAGLSAGRQGTSVAVHTKQAERTRLLLLHKRKKTAVPRPTRRRRAIIPVYRHHDRRSRPVVPAVVALDMTPKIGVLGGIPAIATSVQSSRYERRRYSKPIIFLLAYFAHPLGCNTTVLCGRRIFQAVARVP